MAFYGSRIPNFIEGKSEDEVRKKLFLIGQQLEQKLEIASIYYNSGKGRIVAWYFHDIKIMPLPPKENIEAPKKVIKKTKKKVKKKV